jgi:hypothetical protein
MRRGIAAALLALPLALPGWRGEFDRADTLAALDGASARAACIVRVETGGTFDPNAVGAQGELGAAQLRPAGLLPDFYRQGYDDPFDPYRSVAYLDGALARGLARNWSPVLLGWC